MWKSVLVISLAMATQRPARAKPAPSKIALAKLTVEKYAYEAYPTWAMNHPDQACPASLVVLNEYMQDRAKADIKDPWSHDFKLMCGAGLPPGAKGIAIVSSGPDGKPGTADDIKSWEH